MGENQDWRAEDISELTTQVPCLGSYVKEMLIGAAEDREQFFQVELLRFEGLIRDLSGHIDSGKNWPRKMEESEAEMKSYHALAKELKTLPPCKRAGEPPPAPAEAKAPAVKSALKAK